MEAYLRRLKYRWQMWVDLPEALNRRVQVECDLFEMASGKKPLPDAAKCREMAVKLGVRSRK